jgi:hypothetical protein
MLQASSKLTRLHGQHVEADVIMPVSPHDSHDIDGTVRKKAGNTRKVWYVLVI